MHRKLASNPTKIFLTISIEMNLIQRIIRYFAQGLIFNVLGGNLERALTFVKLDLLD